MPQHTLSQEHRSGCQGGKWCLRSLVGRGGGGAGGTALPHLHGGRGSRLERCTAAPSCRELSSQPLCTGCSSWERCCGPCVGLCLYVRFNRNTATLLVPCGRSHPTHGRVPGRRGDQPPCKASPSGPSQRAAGPAVGPETTQQPSATTDLTYNWQILFILTEIPLLYRLPPTPCTPVNTPHPHQSSAAGHHWVTPPWLGVALGAGRRVSSEEEVRAQTQREVAPTIPSRHLTCRHLGLGHQAPDQHRATVHSRCLSPAGGLSRSSLCSPAVPLSVPETPSTRGGGMPGLPTHVPQAPTSHGRLWLSLRPAERPPLGVCRAPQTQPPQPARNGGSGADCPSRSGLQARIRRWPGVSPQRVIPMYR